MRAPQAISSHVESEKAAVSAALRAGPLAELQQQLDAVRGQLAEATGTIRQMKLQKQEELSRFEDGLHR